MRHLVRGDLVTDGGRTGDALVVVDGDRFGWTGPASTWTGPEPLPPPAPGRLLLPGLVDVHCHGGAGAGFPDSAAAGLRAACAWHHAGGTTTLLGSLVSAGPARLRERIAALQPLVDDGLLAGVHLEGPFLAPGRCGAHDPDALLPGDPALLAGLLATGAVRSVTLAPETAAAHRLLDLLADAGAVAGLGHTDATAAQTSAAIEAARGPLAATHLFNAMPPWSSRSAGPVAACLAAAGRGRMVLELVADGVHLADETVRAVFDLVGPGQLALVTDATAAAGLPDGRAVLGGREVEVTGGVARLARGDGQPGPIAGGTGRLLDVLRRTVRHAGVPLPDAVAAATATPAALLGLGADVGSVAPGHRADLLVTDPGLAPVAVLRAGAWLPASPGGL